MPAILIAAIAVIVALVILGAVVHALFTPWLLIPIAVLAWIKFGPRRSRR